jgi:membrane dipeptidase
LHADNVADGLIAKMEPQTGSKNMRKGGLTAANRTGLGLYSSGVTVTRHHGQQQPMFATTAHSGHPVRGTADIHAAKAQGKTGNHGFQNAHAFEDQIGHVEVF